MVLRTENTPLVLLLSHERDRRKGDSESVSTGSLSKFLGLLVWCRVGLVYLRDLHPGSEDIEVVRFGDGLNSWWQSEDHKSEKKVSFSVYSIKSYFRLPVSGYIDIRELNTISTVTSRPSFLKFFFLFFLPPLLSFLPLFASFPPFFLTSLPPPSLSPSLVKTEYSMYF